MGGQIHHGFLSGVTFKKSGGELKALALKKMVGFQEMVEVRNKRIEKYRKEHEISDADLIELLRQQNANNRSGMSVASYALSNKIAATQGTSSQDTSVRMIPAGVVAALEAENSNIDDEKKAIERLRLITSNMSENESFAVSLQDLEFLGL